MLSGNKREGQFLAFRGFVFVFSWGENSKKDYDGDLGIFNVEITYQSSFGPLEHKR